MKIPYPKSLQLILVCKQPQAGGQKAKNPLHTGVCPKGTGTRDEVSQEAAEGTGQQARGVVVKYSQSHLKDHRASLLSQILAAEQGQRNSVPKGEAELQSHPAAKRSPQLWKHQTQIGLRCGGHRQDELEKRHLDFLRHSMSSSALYIHMCI